MAEEKKEEKIFTIPLRKAYETARTRRTAKASRLVREFLEKHLKVEDVKIGPSINHSLWSRGIQKPPHSIRVHVLKEDKTVYAELLGIEIKKPSLKEKEEKEKKKAEKEKKIKEDRKERKKMTIQEEIKNESGAAPVSTEAIAKEEAKVEAGIEKLEKEQKSAERESPK
ncbi:MAG: 50S ribosomal protein L31e [Candidatus Aenigmarchaeota archaeon]|nr:50S ribosomal protein L31e [Candidatus Aenigmarchaeota archaeon]